MKSLRKYARLFYGKKPTSHEHFTWAIKCIVHIVQWKKPNWNSKPSRVLIQASHRHKDRWVCKVSCDGCYVIQATFSLQQVTQQHCIVKLKAVVVHITNCVSVAAISYTVDMSSTFHIIMLPWLKIKMVKCITTLFKLEWNIVGQAAHITWPLQMLAICEIVQSW